MPQSCRDGGERHAGGHGSDAVTVAQAFWTGLRPADRGSGHQPGDFAVGGGSGERPQAPGSVTAAWYAQLMHELQRMHELTWDRHLAPGIRPPFQRADPYGDSFEVDVAGADLKHLGNARAGVGECQRKCLVRRRRTPCLLEEAGPFPGSQVLAAATVDESYRRDPWMRHYV